MKEVELAVIARSEATKQSSLLKSLWQNFKSLIGEDAYDKYLEHQRNSHPETKTLTRKEFYKQDTDSKWNSIRRCC